MTQIDNDQKIKMVSSLKGKFAPQTNKRILSNLPQTNKKHSPCWDRTNGLKINSLALYQLS